MDDRLASIFASISDDEVAAVAASVLGRPLAPASDVTYAQIDKPHADGRTIGIVRVTGKASAGDWSCVCKIIDLSALNYMQTPVDPRNEVSIYERGLFAATDGGFRAARCHHISRVSDTVTILWLEDLTGADGAPFTIDQLAEMARHLGRWNAVTAAQPPTVDFPLGKDFQWATWQGFDFPARAETMVELADTSMVRAMFARQPLHIARQYVAAYGAIAERSLALPHALQLADCPVSNFFHMPGQTIAIDWAGLGSEPIGGDGGRFIGSALTWGRHFIDVFPHEGELFECYYEGLRSGGAQYDRRSVRIGYLSEAGNYLAHLCTMPTAFSGPTAKLNRSFIEKRFDMTIDELGTAIADAIDALPAYTDEMHALLN